MKRILVVLAVYLMAVSAYALTPTRTPTITATPNWTPTVTPTVTTIPTLGLEYLSTNTSGHKTEILIQWNDIAEVYTLYYGSAGEYYEILNKNTNYSSSIGRYVYPLQNLRYEGIYGVTVTAKIPQTNTTVISNAIQVKPKASPTP